MRNHVHAVESASAAADDDEDVAIDFSNAVLYLGGLQLCTACFSISAISIASCIVFPSTMVSAVRSLVLSSLIGAAIVRKPFRLGRVHGLTLVFRALQPGVIIYLVSLVVEQLTHACAVATASPSWRSLFFSVSTFLMLLSGFLRARRPLAPTDFPFLLTCLALFGIAMLPPPPVIASGPLCSSPSWSTVAERLVRSWIFGLVYSCFVYVSAPPVQSSGEVLVCIMRAAGASAWTLACSVYLLPLALVQIVYVVYVRVFSDEYTFEGADEYSPLPRKDIEVASPIAESASPVSEIAAEPSPRENGVAIVEDGLVKPSFTTLGRRPPVEIGGTTPKMLSSAEMAAIAARLETD